MSYSTKLPWLVYNLLHPYTVLNWIRLGCYISLLLFIQFLKWSTLLYWRGWFRPFNVKRKFCRQSYSSLVHRWCTPLTLLITTWIWNLFLFWYLNHLGLLKLQSLSSTGVVITNLNWILLLINITNLLTLHFLKFNFVLWCLFNLYILLYYLTLNLGKILKLLKPIINKI